MFIVIASKLLVSVLDLMRYIYISFLQSMYKNNRIIIVNSKNQDPVDKSLITSLEHMWAAGFTDQNHQIKVTSEHPRQPDLNSYLV